jgi:hypothetical protein
VSGATSLVLHLLNLLLSLTYEPVIATHCMGPSANVMMSICF